MATAPTLPLAPFDEYLNSTYRPDREYVDGVLVERSVPTVFHALLQLILGAHFRQFERQYRFKTLPEVRTQIVAGARYRVPDILLCATPMPKGRIIDIAPLEILSPDDRMSETLQPYREYETIGVKAIVQMDPERHVAHRFESGSLLETRFHSLYLAHVSQDVPFDSDRLFEQLRSEHNEATAE